MKSEVTSSSSDSVNKIAQLPSASIFILFNLWGVKKSRLLFIILAPFLLNSCITSWVLKNNENLYNGASIQLESDTTIEKKGTLKGEMADGLYPLTNRKTLGMPLRMWVYQILGEPRKKGGLRYYLKYTYGEPPVLISDVPVENVKESLQNVLKANGFLDAKVTAESYPLWWNKNRIKINYTGHLNTPYYLGKITNEISDSNIMKVLRHEREKTLLHSGDRYSLNNLKLERKQIDDTLKSYGYFYFSPDFIIFTGDSTVDGKKINLSMQIRSDLDSEYLKPWYINNVLVTEKSLEDSLVSDTVNIQGVDFTGRTDFRIKLLRRYILFKKGDLIVYDNYNATNKNISSLVTFKFADIDFKPDTITPNQLNVNINLLSGKSKTFQAEVDIVSTSTNFIGPAIILSHTNHNLWHGGEQLTFKLGGSIEGWLKATDAGKTLGNYNYEINNTDELNIPRFLLINQALFPPHFIPYTNFTLQFRLEKQVQYYDMSVFRTSFGYRWNENNIKYHELNVADISFQHLFQTTHTFDSMIVKNSLLKRSFEDQFIIGSNYTYRYSLPQTDPRRIKTAFTGNIDVAGNTLYAIQKLLGIKPNPLDSTYHVFGTIFSQYTKFTLDFRSYFSVGRSDKIAIRALAGIGIPFGNSTILPNLKQYFIGGANSIRAFQPRTVGPGNYLPPPDSSQILVDQTGDIQLQGNIEYRLHMSKILELALFFDAGNIWLARNDPARPGAQFSFNSFYKQLAEGWGFGVRYLNQYFIIRVDVGYPLKLPGESAKVGNWKQALINLAIGYPF